MPEVKFPEWRNEHEQQNYPFADYATLTNSSGVQIPKEVFLDARVYPVGGAAVQYISKITRTATSIILTLSDLNGELATATYNLAAPSETAEFYDTYGRPAGIMVADTAELSVFSAWPLGDQEFDIDQTPLAASVIVPMPATGVSGLVVGSDALSGDVWLVGGQGVVLSAPDDTTIQVDFVGDPLYLREKCEEIGGYTAPTPLQTINGIGPDEYGNFSILAGSDVNYASDNVLRIEVEAGTGFVIYAANVDGSQ